MRCTYLKAMLFALAVITAPALSHAADSPAIPITGAPAVAARTCGVQIPLLSSSLRRSCRRP